MVPLRTLKRLRQSLQVYGMDGWDGQCPWLPERQSGQVGRCFQRSSSNHLSAVASSGNLRSNSMIVRPLRSARPGPLGVWLLGPLMSIIIPRTASEIKLYCTGSTCAVERRFLLAGANPAQQLSLRLVAARAVRGGNEMD